MDNNAYRGKNNLIRSSERLVQDSKLFLITCRSRSELKTEFVRGLARDHRNSI
jgi:hypothetical protein